LCAAERPEPRAIIGQPFVIPAKYTPSGFRPGALRRPFGVAVVLALALGSAGCSAIGSMFSKDDAQAFNEEPADKLYNQALYALNGKKLDEATKQFEEVDKQHPYSEYARKAVLMTVYTKYTAGDYDAAINNAKRYLALHPGSADAAYAQFLMGMSYYNQIPDVTRDQQRTERALAALNEVVRKWPDSEYAEAARKRIEVAKDQLAGREMEVGRFYLSQRNFIGAVNRFKIVVTNYQRTRHVEEALARLAEAYMALGVVNEAQTAAAILGHNYPDSQWYKDTYALVKTDGAEPREDTGSWMSKAFKKVGLG
jgi:outer membrane protein assembly factor BamD